MTEYDSEVLADLHKRILTVVHQDDAVALDKLLKTESEITEATLFMVYSKRNLLHIASYNQAKNCVRLLANPPYSWDVDRLDAVNRTPLHFAEIRDDFSVLMELAPHSRELHLWDMPVSRPEFDGHPATVLFWPQDLHRRSLTQSAMVSIRSVGISGCYRDLSGQFVYKTRMIGPHVALLFELFMATPSLFSINLWTGEEETTDAMKSFWPIPSTSTIELLESEHANCVIYPHCLYLTSVDCLRRNSDAKSTLIALRHTWMAHRFGLHKPVGSDVLLFGQVPPLMALCRMVIRRLLVQHMIENKVETNYLQVLRKLNQPDSVEQFLLYRCIWDANGDWERYLTDGHGGNVPCGYRLTVKRIEADSAHGPGVLIGHRFIPDRIVQYVC